MHGTFKSNKGMRQALNGLFWRASPGPHGCLRKRRLSFCDMIVYQHTVTYINSCYFYANIKMQSRVPEDPISKFLIETSTTYQIEIVWQCINFHSCELFNERNWYIFIICKSIYRFAKTKEICFYLYWFQRMHCAFKTNHPSFYLSP